MFPVSSIVSHITNNMCMCVITCRVLTVLLSVGAFETYLTAVMALQYCEQPDYTALQSRLSAALLQLGGSLELPLSF